MESSISVATKFKSPLFHTIWLLYVHPSMCLLQDTYSHLHLCSRCVKKPHLGPDLPKICMCKEESDSDILLKQMWKLIDKPRLLVSKCAK